MVLWALAHIVRDHVWSGDTLAVVVAVEISCRIQFGAIHRVDIRPGATEQLVATVTVVTV